MRNDTARSNAPLSVTRVLQILDVLSTTEQPINLTRLSQALSVPKSSLVALLRGLVEADFVVFSEKAYQLGPRAFDLGGAMVDARRRRHTSDNIRDAMRDLNKRSGETILYAVLNTDDSTTMSYIDIAESRNAIRISVTIGDRRPLYCTAGGRALLSAMSDAEVHHYLDVAKLKKLTAKTEVNKARLFKAVQLARKEQVACISDELDQGVAGIASLIRDASGTVLGTLILAAPTARIDENRGKLVSLVRQASQAISRNLGYRPMAAAE
jgi:DNA-binding IclR family transcriptional regulator